MGGKYDGKFSSDFLSLQLQLKTLLEDVGGDDALRFLDCLSTLNPSERSLALKVFQSVIAKISNGTRRLETDGDKALKEFENNLYDDVLASMREAALAASSKRLEIVRGGKDITPRNAPISIEVARKAKKNSQKPVIN